MFHIHSQNCLSIWDTNHTPTLIFIQRFPKMTITIHASLFDPLLHPILFISFKCRCHNFSFKNNFWQRLADWADVSHFIWPHFVLLIVFIFVIIVVIIDIIVAIVLFLIDGTFCYCFYSCLFVSCVMAWLCHWLTKLSKVH